MESGATAVQLIIHGRVQGVFYRAFVRQAAGREGVAGWAENRPDGTVSVRLEGDPDAVATVAVACSAGSPQAVVERVERSAVEVEGLDGFETR